MIHSFLLIGQSNMAGRGFLNEAENIDGSMIKVLRNGCWQPMFRPINPDRPFSGVSLAESFAEKYSQKHGVEVGLICCADGGTSLDQWQPGGLLFDNAVYSAFLASRTSKIAGVLWHQGEADCADGLWNTYEERFKPVADGLRERLRLKNVPFLLGGLGDFLKDCPSDKNLVNYGKVNAALKHIADSSPLTGFVSAEGLAANPDNLHFNSKALYQFGIRYFEKYEELTGGRTSAEKPLNDNNGQASGVCEK
jgi:hypothetical protein